MQTITITCGQLAEVAQLLNEGEQSEALKELRKICGLVSRWKCEKCGDSTTAVRGRDFRMFICNYCGGQIKSRVVIEPPKEGN
jgi:NAD-dependent SIR2 family protein deacetylase